VVFTDQSISPLGLSEIRERIPDQVQVLQFRVLKNHILIWLISGDQFLTFSSPVNSDDLNAAVKNYSNLIREKSPDDHNEIKKISGDLYSKLIGPARPFLSDEKEICIIPHGIIHNLSFASLISPDNKYFVEEFTLFYS